MLGTGNVQGTLIHAEPETGSVVEPQWRGRGVTPPLDGRPRPYHHRRKVATKGSGKR